MTKNMEICVFAMTQWVYFTYNYPAPEPFFHELYGKIMGDHIYHKWVSYDYDWNRLFVELDKGNQEKLAEWIYNNYHGMDSRRPQ